MTSTTAAAKLERIRLAVIGKLLLRGFIEAAASEDRQCHPDTWELLGRIGTTQCQLDAAQRAIADAANGRRSGPNWWRPHPNPPGPLMLKAIAAYKAWEKRQPKQPEAPLEPNTYRVGDALIRLVYESPVKPKPDERKFAIDISGDESQYFIDGVEVDEDTYEAQAPPSTGEFFIDIGPYGSTELDPDETEPAPAPVQVEPVKPEPVEPPVAPKRPVVFNM